MQTYGIEVGSGLFNKKYESKEVYELIRIANYFPELRKKNKETFKFFLSLYPFD